MTFIEEEINYIKNFPHKDLSQLITYRLEENIKSYQRMLLKTITDLTLKEKQRILKGVIDE